MKTNLYVDGHSKVHNLDPRTKMLMIIFVMIIAFTFYNPLAPLIGIFLVASILIFSVGMAFFDNMFAKLIPIMILTIVILHAFVNPDGKTPVMLGDTVIRIPYFNEMTWEGLYIGFVFSLRITAVYLSSLLLILTTKPEALVSAIVKMKIPFQYASMFGMSLQMIPILQEEASIIIQAQRARGLRENNLIEKIQSLVPLFVPLAVGSMQQAETTAMVLEARGFGAPVKRTELHEIKFTAVDYILIFSCLTIAVGLLVFRITQGDINWINSVNNLIDIFWPF